jgi:hypothetical protein
MSERKNKSVTTPSGVTVVLKEYISAGEFLDINDAKDGADLSKTELAKRLVNAAVVSVDGVTEDIPNVLRALPLADYLFLNKEVTKIVNGDFTEAKIPAQN